VSIFNLSNFPSLSTYEQQELDESQNLMLQVAYWVGWGGNSGEVGCGLKPAGRGQSLRGGRGGRVKTLGVEGIWVFPTPTRAITYTVHTHTCWQSKKKKTQ